MKQLVLLLIIFLFFPISNAIAEPCSGDFNCDGAVAANDVAEFLKHFGRSAYAGNPVCLAGI